jgi:hypothetical protein
MKGENEKGEEVKSEDKKHEEFWHIKTSVTHWMNHLERSEL